jgi:hypothetical protein
LRVKQLCIESLEFLVRNGLLKGYERSGRWREPAGPQHRLGVGKDAAVLHHYAGARGPLYRDAEQWRQAYQVIRGFTTKGRQPLDGASWTLTRLLGPLDVSPRDLLSHLVSALQRHGFQCLDRSDVSAMAAFRMEDSCSTMDLPEPYGKWLQLKHQRANWNDKLDLLVQLRCRIFSEACDDDPAAQGPWSYFDLTVLQRELATSLFLPERQGAAGPRPTERELVELLRHELGRI